MLTKEVGAVVSSIDFYSHGLYTAAAAFLVPLIHFPLSTSIIDLLSLEIIIREQRKSPPPPARHCRLGSFENFCASLMKLGERFTTGENEWWRLFYYYALHDIS